jgi:hypothetical protein
VETGGGSGVGVSAGAFVGELAGAGLMAGVSTSTGSPPTRSEFAGLELSPHPLIASAKTIARVGMQIRLVDPSR